MMLPKSAITSATGSMVSTRMQVERRHAPQGDLGDDAQRAEADPGHAQQFGIGLLVRPHDRAVAGDEFDTDDRGRQVAERGTGAVRRGRRGAGDRLAVDVAEVGHAPGPFDSELLVEVVEPDACLHGHVRAGDARHALHRVERDQVAVGHRRVGERMTAADRLHPPPRLGRLTDDRRDLVGAARLDAPRPARTVDSRPSSAC